MVFWRNGSLFVLWWMVVTLRLFSAGASNAEREDVVVPVATLHNEKQVPLVGLGCASGVREEHITSALSIGYRYLDTAQSYNWGYHEDEVGNAVRNFRTSSSNNNNDPVILQTKVHPEDLGYDATKRAIQQSLERLQVKSIESVLIHKPHCWPGACTRVPEGTWQESWKALEELYDEGVISRSIGICDVTEDLLEELLTQRIKPHIIQNWMDPFHQDTYMRDLIQSHGILYQAYSSLGTQWHHHKGHAQNPVLNHPVLQKIAKAHGADVGQVVVHWATTRHGISILPASTNPTRQEGNLYHSFRFALAEEELDAIDALDGKVPKAKKMDDVSIKFQSDRPVDVYWIGHDGTEEVPIGSVGNGETISLNSFHGHTFRFKDHENTSYRDHTIERHLGSRQVHVIVPEDEEEL